MSPRRSVARTERLNLDLGAVVTRLGTTTNFDNGYYDPQAVRVLRRQRLSHTGRSAKASVSGCRSPWARSATTSAPASGSEGNATGEATFGIYHPWALKVTGGAIFNQRLGSGAFRGYGAGVSVIRRF